MNYTIDASVFVSAIRALEAQHLTSLDFLDQVQVQGATIICPTLVLPECAAAIIRPTGDVVLAERVIRLIESFPSLNLISLTSPLATGQPKLLSPNNSVAPMPFIWLWPKGMRRCS